MKSEQAPLRDLMGKVAVVTGAAGGIGGATARLLADRGATIAMIDKTADGLAPIADYCQRVSAETLSLVVDQSCGTEVDRACSEILDRFGGVDALVNVAGIEILKTIADTTNEDWDTVLGVNLNGPFYFARALLPGILAQKRGSIVNISSAQAHKANPKFGAYAASKAGLIGLNRVIALEGAPYVRSNVVSPGPTRTAMYEAVDESITNGLLADTPLARIGDPRELADAIVFLLSDSSSYITGQVLHVNGGRFMG
jgi:NAD(P)-dependent dehydrogenase (short-subunit alcohol dehydrogenase family)